MNTGQIRQNSLSANSGVSISPNQVNMNNGTVTVSLINPSSSVGSNGNSVKAKMAPSDSISKKTCFLLNNITDANLENQIAEVKSTVPQNCTLWLAELITHRAVTEPNFNELYTNFVTSLINDFPKLDEIVIELLKNNVDRILRSKPCDVQLSKTLKNMGSFLGRLTIARNNHVNLDLVGLIRRAYKVDPDSLDYIIPFVTHLLKNVRHSYVITAVNPWAKEILRVLKELFYLTDKLAIQFEVEILYNYIGCDIRSLDATYYLRNTNA